MCLTFSHSSGGELEPDPSDEGHNETTHLLPKKGEVASYILTYMSGILVHKAYLYQAHWQSEHIHSFHFSTFFN